MAPSFSLVLLPWMAFQCVSSVVAPGPGARSRPVPALVSSVVLGVPLTSKGLGAQEAGSHLRPRRAPAGEAQGRSQRDPFIS